MVNVRVIENRSEFAEIRPAWDKLYALQTEPSPFLHWIWFDTFWAEMDLTGWQPVILTAWRGRELAGAAAIKLGRDRMCGLKFHVAAGLENVHTPNYSWLLSPQGAQETASALLAE